MKRLKKVLAWLGGIVAILIVTAGALYLIYLRPFMQKMKLTEVIQYDPGLTLILGGGGNTGILASDSLVIVIDSKMDEAAERLHETVKQIAGSRPILVVNTHWHTDHSSGNKYYSGQSIMAGANFTKELWIKEAGETTLPTRWLKDRMDVRMGDDTVTFLNLGRNVHTPSDIVVYLHRRKMLFGGDVILNKYSPAILGSADPEGYLWAFNWIPTQFDIQNVVPGHGAVGGIEVLDNFRQYFIDMKLAAEDPHQKDKLVSKYNNWGQIPLVMSTGSTIKAFRKEMRK
jgi:glyoxylase-like metal-dependent hydrolase (beta-lactamase superfamily II)